MQVIYATVDGTATAGANYQALTDIARIPEGQTTATMTVPTVADGLDEPDETFTVRLSHSVNAE